jgi:phosphatidylserine/phosphatidylglycerophosphate/cardiolipin synthase-like enzyme
LDGSRRQISYAVYKIPQIREALVVAARRSVMLRIILENPDRQAGQNTYNTLRALGEDVAAVSKVYVWPQEKRVPNPEGHMGILHAKCAVADSRYLFVSSANLTEYAFTVNMELGLLISGGSVPGQVEAHFERLIATGILT